MERRLRTQARYARIPVDLPVLPWAEQLELFYTLKFGPWSHAARNEAREKLILHNLRIAMKVARRFFAGSTPAEDVVNEACAALIEAVDGFDPDRGYRLTTFAKAWILGRLRDYFRDREYRIRVPVHLYRKIKGLTLDDTEDELERAAIRAKAARVTDMTPGKNMTRGEVAEPLAHGDPAEIVAEADERASAPDRLSRLLLVLSPVEQRVVLARAGVGRERMTQEACGKEVGYHRTWVKGIELRAMEKLKEAAHRA